MTLPRPELVIFDLDGCLIDSESIALAELVGLMGEEGVAVTIDEARDTFLGTSVAISAAWAAARGARLQGAAFADAWYGRIFARYAAELRPMPGADGLLEDLRREGIGCCIATGGSVARMTYALRLTGLDRFFPEGRAHSADAVGAGKPAPDIFLHAARRHGAAPDHCLVVEDAPAGVTGAVQAGMAVEGFVGGSHLDGLRTVHGDRLRDLGARAIHRDLRSLGCSLLGAPPRLGRVLPAT